MRTAVEPATPRPVVRDRLEPPATGGSRASRAAAHAAARPSGSRCLPSAARPSRENAPSTESAACIAGRPRSGPAQRENTHRKQGEKRIADK
eukprot:6199858-Pleurochrysis_carterae.AAC.1